MHKPKAPTFGKWLRQTDQLDAATMGAHLKTYQAQSRDISLGALRGFHMEPLTFTTFLAMTYPRKFLSYQTYLRLTGADTIKIERE